MKYNFSDFGFFGQLVPRFGLIDSWIVENQAKRALKREKPDLKLF